MHSLFYSLCLRMWSCRALPEVPDLLLTYRKWSQRGIPWSSVHSTHKHDYTNRSEDCWPKGFSTWTTLSACCSYAVTYCHVETWFPSGFGSWRIYFTRSARLFIERLPFAHLLEIFDWAGSLLRRGRFRNFNSEHSNCIYLHSAAISRSLESKHFIEAFCNKNSH